MITLQINTNGAWKNVLQFEPTRRNEILRALAVFASVLGRNTRWCLVNEAGKREWLHEDISAWTLTDDYMPDCLQDVMVSVASSDGDQPLVYMAYRKPLGGWYLSGTADDKIGNVYAWAPIIIEPASVPTQEVAA